MTSQGAGPATYGRLLRHGPAVRPFAAAVVARLPISMAPLGALLLVQHETGSYAVAGLVTGAFALGTAVGSPVWGRAMDRHGQSRVIVPTVLVSALLLAALAVATVSGAATAALVLLAWTAGGTMPPFSAAMRTSWRRVVDDPQLRRAAYALDAVAVETIFVGGPLLLALLLVVTPPVAPLLITAGLLACGGLAYAASRPARHRAERSGETSPGQGTAATAPGLPAVLAVGAAMSVGFGTIDTSLAATAREVLGNEGRLGLLFAALAGGSAIGGLWYGVRVSHVDEQRRLPWTLGAFALGLAPLPILLSATRPALWALLPLLFVAGLSIAPSLIIQQNLVDRFAAAGRANEAQAWLSTAVTTGAAAGTALAGVVVDHAGVSRSFTVAVITLALAAALALVAQAQWRTDGPR